MVTFIFRFDSRKGHRQIHGPKSEIQNVLSRTYPPCPALYRDAKNAMHFDAKRSKITKIAFRKSDVISYRNLIFGHCTGKNKHIALKCWTLLAGIYFWHILRLCTTPKKDSYAFIFEKSEWAFGGNIEKIKSSVDCRFVEPSFFVSRLLQNCTF